MELEFEQVYEDHLWHVYGFLAYRLSSRQDAEDLTQETFERAHRAWSRFDNQVAAPRTWLMTIARNLLIDHFRGDRATEQEFDPEKSGVMHTDPEVGIDPDLARALDQLGEREREVIALRFGGDMTGREIAAELDISLANAQQILSRALRKLRRLLADEAQAAKGPAPTTPSAAIRSSTNPETE